MCIPIAVMAWIWSSVFNSNVAKCPKWEGISVKYLSFDIPLWTTLNQCECEIARCIWIVIYLNATIYTQSLLPGLILNKFSLSLSSLEEKYIEMLILENEKEYERKNGHW